MRAMSANSAAKQQNPRMRGAHARANSGLKAALFSASLLMAAALCVQTAAAQTNAQTSAKSASETPLAASIQPETRPQLPADLNPVKLDSIAPREIDAETAKKLRAANRNSWDPNTLTRSAGLSAATMRNQAPGAQSGDAENPATFTNPKVSAALAGPVGPDLLTAQDLLSVGEIKVPNINISAEPPAREGVINLSSSLRGALFDLPTDNVNASVFKLDLGERLCLGTADECDANTRNDIGLGYAKNITHGKVDGLNLQLTPRAGIRLGDDSKSAVVGALLRVGDNLRGTPDAPANTWYVFAGADAETVSYNQAGFRSLSAGAFQLQNRLLVGDAQAGVGYRIGDADLALTYFKRQATGENYNYDEDAAALSVTWKR